jgi:RimJ/RimL family protein N-acetyltransferase
LTVIETARRRLRPWALSDLGLIVEMNAEPRARRYTGDLSTPLLVRQSCAIAF